VASTQFAAPTIHCGHEKAIEAILPLAEGHMSCKQLTCFTAVRAAHGRCPAMLQSTTGFIRLQCTVLAGLVWKLCSTAHLFWPASCMVLLFLLLGEDEQVKR
jgi:hypothetical protein